MKGRLDVDPQQIRLLQQQLKKNLGTFYYHRGLVYRKLGKVQNAMTDMRKSKDLGFDPEKEW